MTARPDFTLRHFTISSEVISRTKRDTLLKFRCRTARGSAQVDVPAAAGPMVPISSAQAPLLQAGRAFFEAHLVADSTAASNTGTSTPGHFYGHSLTHVTQARPGVSPASATALAWRERQQGILRVLFSLVVPNTRFWRRPNSSRLFHILTALYTRRAQQPALNTCIWCHWAVQRSTPSTARLISSNQLATALNATARCRRQTLVAQAGHERRPATSRRRARWGMLTQAIIGLCTPMPGTSQCLMMRSSAAIVHTVRPDAYSHAFLDFR